MWRTSTHELAGDHRRPRQREAASRPGFTSAGEGFTTVLPGSLVLNGSVSDSTKVGTLGSFLPARSGAERGQGYYAVHMRRSQRRIKTMRLARATRLREGSGDLMARNSVGVTTPVTREGRAPGEGAR